MQETLGMAGRCSAVVEAAGRGIIISAWSSSSPGSSLMLSRDGAGG